MGQTRSYAFQRKSAIVRLPDIYTRKNLCVPPRHSPPPLTKGAEPETSGREGSCRELGGPQTCAERAHEKGGGREQEDVPS